MCIKNIVSLVVGVLIVFGAMTKAQAQTMPTAPVVDVKESTAVKTERKSKKLALKPKKVHRNYKLSKKSKGKARRAVKKHNKKLETIKVPAAPAQALVNN